MINMRIILLTLTAILLTFLIQIVEVNSEISADQLLEQNPDFQDSPSILLDDTDDENEVHDDSSSSDGSFSDSDDDSEYDEYDDEHDDEELSKFESGLQTVLGKTKQTAGLTISYAQKHRTELTVALALFAFRREIYWFLSTYLTTPTEDGKGRKLKFSVRPTAILKILLFLDFMWKMRSGGGGGDTEPTGIPRSGRSGSALGELLFGMLLPSSNQPILPSAQQHYTFERINDRYYRDGKAFQKATAPYTHQTPMERIRERARHAVPAASNNSTSVKPVNSSIVVVLELLHLDVGVSNLDVIRDKVSFLLHEHRQRNKNIEKPDSNTTDDQQNNEQSTNNTISELEVIIPLESPGGIVHVYGLAADQIRRLRNEPGIKVTVCVDKIAASGGYMMACMSSPDRLFAAPFALVGSIGVIRGPIPNIHKLLEDRGVRSLLFTGGEHKAPITITSEVTEEGIKQVQKEINQAHVAFKRHVVAARPQMEANIDAIASGEIWYGPEALEAGLVDRIITSDEYISEKIEEGSRVLRLISVKGLVGFFPRDLLPYRKDVLKIQDGSGGKLSGFFRSFSDVVGELKTILGKINDVMEGSHSGVVMAKASGVNNVRVMKR